MTKLVGLPPSGSGIVSSVASAPSPSDDWKTSAGIEAAGELLGKEFMVRSESRASLQETTSLQSCYVALRRSLIENGILVSRNGSLYFSQDYLFSSSSTASSILLGASSNGRDVWKTADGQTLKDDHRGKDEFNL